MAPSTTGCFSQAGFRFLRALTRHNEREWSLAHKTEFEMYLRQLRLQLIADSAGPLLTHGWCLSLNFSARQEEFLTEVVMGR